MIPSLVETMMAAEAVLYYFCRPVRPVTQTHAVEFVSVQEFLADEPACQILWDLLTTQFHTRSKFLAIWPCVRYVAVHRAPDGSADGFLLVSTPVNWQIDYVVVRPDRRGCGIATALVAETVNQAVRRAVPYLMLTSRAGLRDFYESCGFQVVAQENPGDPVHPFSSQPDQTPATPPRSIPGSRA